MIEYKKSKEHSKKKGWKEIDQSNSIYLSIYLSLYLFLIN